MDKNLLVQIVVPVGDKGWEIGTGYPVAKDRILTARHVLFPKNRNKTRKIEIRWFHLSGPAKKWDPIDDSCIIEESYNDLDVAIINHPFPEQVDNWGILSEDKPSDHVDWVSQGFASAGKLEGDVQEPVDLKGNTYSMADTQTSFKLGVDDKVQEEKQWKGASGSPVFVNGVILGVIISCPPNFDGNRFRATPTWKLLEQDGFRKAIGYDERNDTLKNVKSRLEMVLAISDKAQKELSEQMGSTVSGGNIGVKTLAEELLHAPLERLLKACKASANKMCAEGEKQALFVIREVINEMLPVMFGEGVIERVKAYKAAANATLISLPINTHTAAEVIMSGFDKRKTSFKELLPNFILPEGKYALPLLPEGGNNSKQAQYEKDFHQQMRLFAGEELLQQSTAADESRIIKAAAQELEYLSTQDAKTGILH